MTIIDALIAHGTVTSEAFGHKIDTVTHHCRRCGSSLEQLVENDVPDCHEGDNLIGFEHHRVLRACTMVFSRSPHFFS